MKYTATLVLFLICMCNIATAAPGFKIDKLTPELAVKIKQSFKSLPFDINRQRVLTVPYHDFEGNAHEDGKIMVLDAVAPQVGKIFQELHDLKFPLQNIKLMSDYDFSDDKSMAANNTSAFNYRNTTAGKLPSLHSYGLAIDINPMQNPYVSINVKEGIARCLPKVGVKYLNRNIYHIDISNKIKTGIAEEVVRVFAKHGFNIWGGNWQSPIDYQHFQVSRELATVLVKLDSKTAGSLFEKHIIYSNQHKRELLDYIKEHFHKKYPSEIDRIESIFESHLDELKAFILNLRI